MPGILPGNTHHPATPSAPRRVLILLKRRPVFSSILAITLATTIFLVLSPAQAQRISSATKSSWYSSSDGDYTSAASKAAQAASDRQRCDTIWREEHRGASWGGSPGQSDVGAVPPKGGWSKTGDGADDVEDEGWGEEGLSSSVHSGSDNNNKFSMAREISKGKSRKRVLQEMVAKTNGYYARDYSLWLGWNNVRYIIEASVLQADILNRTLVIPTYVYARACEFDKHTCASFAKMVNRGDALESDEWRDQPLEKQWAWVIPTELMIDVPLLQETHSIITTADFLLLQDQPASIETAKGNWNKAYHPSASYHEIPNRDYDTDLVRVDRLPDGYRTLTHTQRTAGLGGAVRKLFEGSKSGDVKDLGELLEKITELSGRTEDEAEKMLAEVGVWVLRTWQGSHKMEYVRTVTDPIKQVALGENMKGWWNDYHHITDEVLYLQGEIHYWRKPGSVRFTSAKAQSDFAKVVLFGIMPPSKLFELSIRLDERMREKVGGRMWMGAHMRRGDFVKHNWVMNNDAYQHFDRIKRWMGTGAKTLQNIKSSGKHETYSVPDAWVARDFELYDAPQIGDPFYLATDERNATHLEYFKANGAIFIGDLITAADRRDLDAWSLVFTDVLGVLEQTMLARGSFFYGHALSSVAGGAVNHRATLGKDPRTTVID
ncbi:hypothetical protein [Phaffia rhodozyma]|uniref:Uncharacterized protein n=1 Tax=Phaffia rhodozyma TaxID=264483 RepID=A0A0F7STQ8_PHARH|nr:hypothetical protein [Phaffia rhodozyma]